MGKFLSNKLNVSKSIYLFTSILLILLSLGINVKAASASAKENIYELSTSNMVKGYFKGIDFNGDNLLVKSEITDFHLFIESSISNFECTSKNLKEFIYHLPNLKVKTNINKIHIDCSSKDSQNKLTLDSIDKNTLSIKNKYKKESKKTMKENNGISFSWGFSKGSTSITTSINPSDILIKENAELKICSKTIQPGLKQNCDYYKSTKKSPEINFFDLYIQELNKDI